MQVNKVSNSTSFNGRLLIPSHKDANKLVDFSERRVKLLLKGNMSKYDLGEYIGSLKNLFKSVKKEPENFNLTVYPVPENGNVRFLYNVGENISEVFEQTAKHLKVVGDEIAISYRQMIHK